MQASSLISAGLLLASIGVACIAPDARGYGLGAGLALGAALSLVAVRAQRHAVEKHPARVLHILLAGFALKLFAVFLTALIFYVVPSTAALFDPAYTLLALAGAALLVLAIGTRENARRLRQLAPPISVAESALLERKT